MAQIFISYKRTDRDKVFPLVKSIENELGCKCWVDLDGIESSMQFASVICRAIDNAEVVLFMHSAVHLSIDYENDWTVKELNYAQQKRKRVVLVRLDGAPLDNIFLMNYGSKNNIDSRDPLQFEKLLNDLRSWLQLPQHKSTLQPEVMCPCGSGKLFKDCHGKHAVVPESYASKPTGPVSDLTKASPAAYDDIISKISNILKTYKINVLSITADIRSTGVMYRIVPGSGIRPAAIANLHREIAFALGVCEAIVIEYSDGTVALTLKDYDSPVERTWKVGDYYDVGGKKGVVFWVDETGKHGKIVSLDQAEKQWCTGAEYRKKLTGITSDEYDGMKNLQSIQKISDWRNKYPAFAWCADHGDGWYLPAIKELELLLLNDEVHDAVNNQIAREGKTRLFSKGGTGIYCSSTESAEWCAWAVFMYAGDTSSRDKSYSGDVRAVSAF
jgi:hypothetical protein